ncbi:CUB and sushi domain-containing protein 3-like isoform X2 [Actinia tenebrosa]|uniref:CUB and sushi domain-containing protein 3-like isoform X2 n=1 Tax=Actinia tenebrosa TaxID=6105 RepID=A0A6P8HY25_ACTTE|nr:CUB and sushi domain-containing protein 3-like isoform X2 [Actinia tenebrosa]
MLFTKEKVLVLMVFVFALFKPKTDASTCSTLSIKLPLKARHVGSSTWFGAGDVLKFHCESSGATKPYYKLKGVIKIECQKDGTWSSKIPICAASACPAVGPSVPNAQLLTTIIPGGTNNFGNRINYRCNLGFKLGSSSSNKICQKNGYWEGNVTCVGIVCPLPSINYGNVTYSSLGYGSVANYTCDKGYAVNGQPIRICDKSGHWSGNTPLCLRLCPQLSAPTNGYIKNLVDYLASREVGATIRFVCNPNYRMRGNKFRTCEANGRWSGQQPKCVINTCGSPGPFSNGVMTSSLPNYIIGTVVNFSCHSGYKLIGDVSRRTCMHDGHWTGIQNPTCKILFCEEPGNIFYGSHDKHSDKYSYGSSVSYSCDSRYYLWGNATLTCQAVSSGLTYWSGSIPSCLTLPRFEEKCVRLKGKFKVEHGRPICLFPATTATHLKGERKADRELDTLTIVTASAGSTLGALVILLSVMVFVRRFHRSRRFRNHSIRSRFYSDDDHVTLIATCREDVHFALPSYDEAMSQVQRDPPPFETVVQSNGVGPTNNNSPVLPITGVASNPEGRDDRDNPSAHAQNENSADQHINIVNNPMNENSSEGTSLLSQVANQGETPSEQPQESFVMNTLSSEESLVESDPTSSREGLNLSVSEDEQSINESQPLIISNT